MRERDGANGAEARQREREADGDGEAEEPAHHARRPMNAFLIFCKRHRAVVRDKYPNLENRAITKILGEWWANLEQQEKACYTGLAKQYKDAFFSANPDFKWYKLPAPPLRTLSSRPADVPERPPVLHPPDPPLEPLRTNNNSTRYDYNKRIGLLCDDPSLSMFTPGKLADEAHMGGLSSLLTSNQTETSGLKHDAEPYISSPYTTSTPIPVRNEGYRADVAYSTTRSQYSERPKGRSREDDIRELQNALSETTRIFEDFDEKPKQLMNFDNNNRTLRDNNFTNQEIINEIVDRRLMKEERLKDDTNKIEYADTARNGRSCKGKRYQEFMAVGGLLVSKRMKRDDMPESFNASCSWECSGQTDGSMSNEDGRYVCHRTEYEMSSESDKPEPQESERESKPFKPADFDLDAKIKALPSLSLEKFQEKKRESKKKKRSSQVKPKDARPRVGATSYEPEAWREAVVGSQKRKPRKVSITRLEVHSMVNRTGELERGPEMKLATEAPHAQLQDAQESGLLALATLAEVAACTSKLESAVPAHHYYL